jgi:hypothetical protein
MIEWGSENWGDNVYYAPSRRRLSALLEESR